MDSFALIPVVMDWTRVVLSLSVDDAVTIQEQKDLATRTRVVVKVFQVAVVILRIKLVEEAVSNVSFSLTGTLRERIRLAIWGKEEEVTITQSSLFILL